MDNNERIQQLELQIEELSNKVQETRKVFFEKECIINQDIKIKDVQYYATPIANKIILENGFIINYDGSFDVSISSFSTRGILTDEAKRIEKEINEQIELYSKALYLLNRRDNVKADASRIFDKYVEEIYPLEKELYGLRNELQELKNSIREEELKKQRDLYKNELLNAGDIYVIQSMQFNNREYYSEFSFTTDRNGNLVANVVRDSIKKKIKIKDEDIRKIHNQIFREVGKLRFNIDEKYYKKWNVLSKEEYEVMRTKGYDAIDWKECTYKEYRKVI